MLDGKTIFLTGGTGSFGKKFIQMTLAKYKPKKIIVFSRDELKQFEMMDKYSPENYPIRYFLGDVRDLDRLRRAMRGTDVVVHAAAYKHVPAAEYNPFEFVKTNIIGAQNVIEASLDAGVKQVVALSTDKACNPINLYGATKLASDKMFVAANSYSGAGGTCFSVVRYGNVVGSRGSVIPFFMNQAAKGNLTITDPEMTRFWITLDEAVNMVWRAMKVSKGGEIYVSKIPSMNIMDLAEVIAPNVKKDIIGIRPGEKIHECMISEDDARYTFEYDNYYAIFPAISTYFNDALKSGEGKLVPQNFRYSSEINPQKLTRDELRKLLSNYVHKGPELVSKND
jgi:UDP-N-acetylglucosamine 4,6-dehydratase (inverting)